VLCPLNNVPLLKHSIDFLQVSWVRIDIGLFLGSMSMSYIRSI
jgi:hypothetical protein